MLRQYIQVLHADTHRCKRECVTCLLRLPLGAIQAAEQGRDDVIHCAGPRALEQDGESAAARLNGALGFRV